MRDWAIHDVAAHKIISTSTVLFIIVPLTNVFHAFVASLGSIVDHLTETMSLVPYHCTCVVQSVGSVSRVCHLTLVHLVVFELALELSVVSLFKSALTVLLSVEEFSLVVLLHTLAAILVSELTEAMEGIVLPFTVIESELVVILIGAFALAFSLAVLHLTLIHLVAIFQA